MAAIKKSSLSEVVYDRITQMLFDGIYPPGAGIVRREIAEKLAVSPTPVGEAIARLVGEGIIEQYGRSGYRVKDFSYEDLEALYAVRAGIESIAVRLCVEKLDDKLLNEIGSCFDEFQDVPVERVDISAYMKADQRFHRKIVISCGNSYVINYNRSYEFLLRSYQKGLLRSPTETIDEHKSIISAIKRRDAHSAQDKMAEHHLATSRSIRKQYLGSSHQT